MEYGKRITTESYFKGELKSSKVEYATSSLVMDKSQVLSEIIKALELISTKQTSEITIGIIADRKTHSLKMMTKKYTIEK